MREIGSEFWEVPVIDKENSLFPKTTQWFLSGRSALQAIIEEIKEDCEKDCKTVAMPFWCCDSMVRPFLEAGMEVNFYPVYWQDDLYQEVRTDKDVLFLMDYFGYTGSIPDVSDYKGIVIRDVTHSLFSTSYTEADYYFGSLRKWCGVWTGGYAWTRDGHELPGGISNFRINQSMRTEEKIESDISDGDYIALRKKAMQRKTAYISGECHDKGYLKDYSQAEEILEKPGIFPASQRDIELAKRMDVEKIISRRRANAGILQTSLSDWLIFKEMKETDCPMFVPVLVPDGKRNELRQYLIKNEIYCPFHWPVTQYQAPDAEEAILYKDELSLVCDQRYTEEDMERMVECIHHFRREEG